MVTTKPSFLILFLLISFGSVSAVLFTPALPQISQYFAITASSAQLTITLFLIGYALGQLLYGPLANRYGRKIALYCGIILEIVASIICIISASVHIFWILALGRLLMALGASVGLKMCFTLVSDSYPPEQSTKLISYLTLAFAITPALGVAIGGWLTDYINWQSCFYFLGIYGLYLLYLSYRMTETATVFDEMALKPSKIIDKYARKLKNTQLVICSLIMGCGTAFVYVFAALAPFIAMDLMHLDPSQYGLWNLLPPVGGIAGSLLSACLAKKLRSIQAIFLGITILIIAVLTMLIAFLLHAQFPIWLFAPMVIIYIGISLVYVNASTLAMQFTEDKSTAAAMMSFINVGMATVSVLLLGFITTQTSLLLPTVFSLLIITALILSILMVNVTAVGKP